MSDAASHCVCMKNLLLDPGVAPCKITTVVHAWAGHNSQEHTVDTNTVYDHDTYLVKLPMMGQRVSKMVDIN